MYRNPKDQVVSWYHFMGKTTAFKTERRDAILGKDWDDFFAKFTAGIVYTFYFKCSRFSWQRLVRKHLYSSIKARLKSSEPKQSFI